MPNDLNISQFDDGVMPVGEYVDLAVDQTYYFIAQARGIWMGAIARSKGLPQKFKFIPEVGIPFEVKGKDWSRIIVFSANQGQNPNLTSLNVVMQTSTSFQMGLAALLGQNFNATNAMNSNSIARLLEIIAPARGSTFLYLNETIASGGADVTGTLGIAGGDLLSFDWCITQDSLGTSPHASYISVKDAAGNQCLYVMGAGNSSGTKIFRGQVGGDLQIVMHNGDSVSHTFMINIYRMIA